MRKPLVIALVAGLGLATFAFSPSPVTGGC
jgi:hypothetical protein